MKFIFLSRLKIPCNQFSKQLNLTCIYVNNNGLLNKNNYSSYSKFKVISKHITMDLDANISRKVKSELRQVLDAGLSSVMPSVLMKNKIEYDGTNLIVKDKPYLLTNNVYMVGFGKAVAGLAFKLVEILGPRLTHGIISVPELANTKRSLDCGTAQDMKNFQKIRKEEIEQIQMLKRSEIVEYLEGAKDNQPDDASYANTNRIIQLVQKLDKDDTLIVLISGGGSALLFAPKPPMKPEEKQDLCKRLQNNGASINELNTVRKVMSLVKGGGLAKMAYPAKVITLILSDVVHDLLDIIASGPTVPVSPANNVDAIRILKKYNLYHTLSKEVTSELFEKVLCDNRSLVANGKFKFVENIIIGNNRTALEVSAKAAKKFGIEGMIMSDAVQGNVKDVSVAYAKFVNIICHTLENNFPTKEDFVAEILKQNLDVLNLTQECLEKAYEIFMSLHEGKSILLLTGGEPTVVVEGDGRGGRNQELALQFSLDWLSEIFKNPELSRYFVEFLSIATDGQDGPTDAAGAFGAPNIRPKMTHMLKDLKAERKTTIHPEKLQTINNKINQMTWMLPENALQRNDTYNFYSKFEKGKRHLKTGFTGTNVMDLNFIYLKKRDCECDLPGVVKTNISIGDNDFLFDHCYFDSKLSKGGE